LTQATDFYLSHHDMRAKSVPVNHAWAECRTEFERRVEANEICLDHLKCLEKTGRKLAGQFGQAELCDLTPQILSEWLKALRSRKTGLPLNTTTKNGIRL